MSVLRFAHSVLFAEFEISSCEHLFMLLLDLQLN